MKKSFVILILSLFSLSVARAQQGGVIGSGTAGTVFAISQDKPVDGGMTRSLAIDIEIRDTDVKTVYVNALNANATVKRIGLKNGTLVQDLWLMNSNQAPPEPDIVCWVFDKTANALKLNFHDKTLDAQPTLMLEVFDKKDPGAPKEVSMVLENSAKSRLTVKRKNQ